MIRIVNCTRHSQGDGNSRAEGPVKTESPDSGSNHRHTVCSVQSEHTADFPQKNAYPNAVRTKLHGRPVK